MKKDEETVNLDHQHRSAQERIILSSPGSTQSGARTGLSLLVWIRVIRGRHLPSGSEQPQTAQSYAPLATDPSPGLRDRRRFGHPLPMGEAWEP
jgi:hypothetical protein